MITAYTQSGLRLSSPPPFAAPPSIYTHPTPSPPISPAHRVRAGTDNKTEVVGILKFIKNCIVLKSI